MKFFTTSAGSLFTKNFRFLPLAHGTQAEVSSATITDTFIDEVNFVVPFDLIIKKAYLNAGRTVGSDAQPGHTKLSLWKAGEKHSDDVIINIQNAGYDTYDLYHVNVFDFKNTKNDYLAGEIMQMGMECEGVIDYYSMTIIGEYLEE